MQEALDVKTALRSALTEKQQLVRNYQSIAQRINNPTVAKMFRHFAESEGLQAHEIKDMLENLS